MASPSRLITRALTRVGTRWLPFADAASPDLPLGRLLRLGLFQVSVGMAMALLAGTLNRVMIVELGVSAGLVASMLSLPLLFAPLRPFIGFRSDTHRSALGWRRVPYLWLGTLLQFGGLAIMPFALVLLTGQGQAAYALAAGTGGAALAFLLVGAGTHVVQTAGLALTGDLTEGEQRPRAVALLYLMLLVGMMSSALVFGLLLRDFTHTRLVQVIQGAAVVAVALNVVALWKQEPRDRTRAMAPKPQTTFSETWRRFTANRRTRRLLVGVALGTAGFSMQDVLLEPYGGQVMGLGVGATSSLTALLAGGSIVAFAVSAGSLGRGLMEPIRLAGFGGVAGGFALPLIVLAAPLASPVVLAAGTTLLGFGGGLFAVGTLTAAMDLETAGNGGLAVGAWGAVQALSAGIAVALGGILRDVFSALVEGGGLVPWASGPAGGYIAVYQLEIAVIFAALITLGPLADPGWAQRSPAGRRVFGLPEMPNG
jgi:BCD family chlorophyll transporter-like MFS transporter